MTEQTDNVLLPDCAILLDVDGVMVDWASRCLEVCGVGKAEGYARWPSGSFLITDALGMTEEKMWEYINAKGSEFWENLDDYPWAEELYTKCTAIAPTYFLTSPSHDTSSHVGKIKWMHRFTKNPKFRNYLLGPAKQLCARQSNLLVDDYDMNVAKFQKAGGSTVLFPQYWNANNDKMKDPLPYVFAEIDKWVAQQQWQRLPQAHSNIELC